MMRLKVLNVLFVIFISASSVFAEVKVYLIPRVNPAGGSVKLEDIARIEGMSEDVNIIRDIVINSDVYSDGYIDRKELFELLRARLDDNIFIYGNAVKIFIEDKSDENNSEPEYIVRSGDKVKFVVIKNGIRIEVAGVAIDSGASGEIIKVKLDNKKNFKGKIINKNLVEIEL